SAACDGENRAQQAIEQALNSPLLNDNDIRGAKWILININSSEGENEFTMDEVETIQNHLLSQAGENSDVILGLGYDNTLENKIGITLIATGFEHKSPFNKKQAPVQEIKKTDEKVVVTLEEEKKKPTQPLYLFDEKNELLMNRKDVGVTEKKEANEIKPQQEMKLNIAEEEIQEEEENLAPKIVETREPDNVKIPTTVREITVDNSSEKIIRFELSSDLNSAPPESKSNLTDKADNNNQSEKNHSYKDASTAQTSGGYLAKPKQIYAEDKPVSKSEVPDKPNHIAISKPEDEPVEEMRLVVKNSNEAAKENQEENVRQTMPIMMSSVEEPPMVD